MKKEPNYKLIIIIIVTVIVLLGLGTYFFIGWKSYKLREEQLKIDQQKLQDTQKKTEQEEKDKKHNESSLIICLRVADLSYSDFWDSECETLGLGKDCKLPTWNAERVDDNKEKDRAECYQKYPTN